MHISPKGSRRALAATLVAYAALVVASSPASAAEVTFNCQAFALDDAGVPGGSSLQAVSQAVTFNISAPTVVAPGTTFDASAPAGDETVPDKSGDIVINEVKNLTSVIEITGAASIGTPVVTGGNVIGATATLSGNVLTIKLPGSQGGSVHPGSGDAFFPGGSTFQRPAITVPITAGAAGTQINFNAKDFQTDSVVLDGAIVAGVRQCAPVAPTLLASTAVVVPGAPIANDDTAKTPQDNATTIDVLANDTPNAERALAPGTLAITVPTTSGALADIVDGKVRYTPPIGFNGTDTFSYQVCSVPNDDGTPGACDSAVVTVTVDPPAAVAQQAAPAAAASNQLPRTGPASRLAIMLGAVLLFVGAAAMVLVPAPKRGRWYTN